MRKIVITKKGNGNSGKFTYLLYDSETATLICNDEQHKKQYYKTKKKNYFMVNLATKELIPKTEDEIKQAIANVSIDDFINNFGKPEDA